MARDIANKAFGRLIAIEPNGKKNRVITWLCRCECGSTKTVAINDLMKGATTSCGCFRREGLKYLKERKIWSAIKQRCFNTKCDAYKWYGARGITMCDRWKESFENFLADMGVKPKNKSIDRKNNDGNYEPDNCRWATAKQQAANRRPMKK